MGPLLMGHVLTGKLFLPGILLWVWTWTRDDSGFAANTYRGRLKYVVHHLATDLMDPERTRVLWTLWCQTLLIFAPVIPALIPFIFCCFVTSSVLLEVRGQSLPQDLDRGYIVSGLLLGWCLQAW